MSRQARPTPLPNSLLFALTVIIYLGWDLIALPGQAVKHLKYNGYMSLVVGALLLLPLFWVAADLARRFPGRTLFQIFLQTLGKPLGAVFCLLQDLMGFFVLFVAVHRAHLMIASYFFRSTPRYILILLFTGSALYLARHGIRSISRLASFLLILPLTVICGLLILGMFNVNLVNVRPILAGRPYAWLQAGVDQLFPLYPATTAFFYLQFFRSPGSVRRVSLGALATIFPIFFLHAFGSIGVFGPHIIGKMAWPGVEFFHVVDFPFFLLEQGGLLFIITWYTLQFVAATQAFFAIGNQTHSVLGGLSEKAHITLAVVLSLPLLLYPIDITWLSAVTDRWVAPAVIGNSALFLLAWLAAVIRRQRSAES